MSFNQEGFVGTEEMQEQVCLPRNRSHEEKMSEQAFNRYGPRNSDQPVAMPLEDPPSQDHDAFVCSLCLIGTY